MEIIVAIIGGIILLWLLLGGIAALLRPAKVPLPDPARSRIKFPPLPPTRKQGGK